MGVSTSSGDLFSINGFHKSIWRTCPTVPGATGKLVCRSRKPVGQNNSPKRSNLESSSSSTIIFVVGDDFHDFVRLWHVIRYDKILIRLILAKSTGPIYNGTLRPWDLASSACAAVSEKAESVGSSSPQLGVFVGPCGRCWVSRKIFEWRITWDVEFLKIKFGDEKNRQVLVTISHD